MSPMREWPPDNLIHFCKGAKSYSSKEKRNKSFSSSLIRVLETSRMRTVLPFRVWDWGLMVLPSINFTNQCQNALRIRKLILTYLRRWRKQLWWWSIKTMFTLKCKWLRQTPRMVSIIVLLVPLEVKSIYWANIREVLILSVIQPKKIQLNPQKLKCLWVLFKITRNLRINNKDLRQVFYPWKCPDRKATCSFLHPVPITKAKTTNLHSTFNIN